METPIQIEFQGLHASEAVRRTLAEQMGKLEERFGRITACRVVVKGPGQHHRSGGLHEIHVHLTLPNGKEVVVGRVNHGDERFADLNFAIGETFKRARRRLQDQARRLREAVKQHMAK